MDDMFGAIILAHKYLVKIFEILEKRLAKASQTRHMLR